MYGHSQISVCNDGTKPENFVKNGGDCDDSDSEISQLRNIYLDKDGDKIGSGNPIERCISRIRIPTGYSLEGGDKDDNNPSIGNDIDSIIGVLFD